MCESSQQSKDAWCGPGHSEDMAASHCASYPSRTVAAMIVEEESLGSVDNGAQWIDYSNGPMVKVRVKTLQSISYLAWISL